MKIDSIERIKTDFVFEIERKRTIKEKKIITISIS